MAPTTEPIYITYLNGLDISELKLTDEEILGAIETALDAQGRKETVIEPRLHLVPRDSAKGHFNVLRGVVHPLNAAGIKVVGDFVDNYKHGLPSEFGILNLFDPETGVPRAVIDATSITDMRTGAVTALGAKYLAPKKELGRPIHVLDNWEETIVGADIVVEASRLAAPEPLLKTSWIKKGALVMPYGTMSALELSLTDIMDKMVVDDWGQCRKGLPLGALRQHVDNDKLTEENLHAEMGQIVAGARKGRESDDETILFWHRGLSLSDIALGTAILDKAAKLDIGQRLRYA
ncbi:NAD(P)-binding protein [Trichoderma asperelloides]|nr:NAD(P)-binding protein [Trichoderma asperelloides]